MDELGDLVFSKKSKRKSTTRQEEYSLYLKEIPREPKQKSKPKPDESKENKQQPRVKKIKKPDVYSDKDIDEMLEDFKKDKKVSLKSQMKKNVKSVDDGMHEILMQNLLNNEIHVNAPSAIINTNNVAPIKLNTVITAEINNKLSLKRKHDEINSVDIKPEESAEFLTEQEDECKQKKTKKSYNKFDDDLKNYADLADIEQETPVEERFNVRHIVFRLTGLPDHTRRFHIKRCLDYYRAKWVYVDYNDGDETAYVRMENLGHAKQILHRIKWNNADCVVNGVDCDVELLDEEAEKNYLSKMKMKQQQWKEEHYTEEGKPTDKLLERIVMKKEAKEGNKALREDVFSQSGVVLLLTNLPPTTHQYELAEKLNSVAPGKVAHVDYTAGEEQSYIMVKLPKYANQIIVGLSGCQINGCNVSASLLGEAEEIAYLSQAKKDHLKRNVTNFGRRGALLMLSDIPASDVTKKRLLKTLRVFTTDEVNLGHMEYTPGDTTAYLHTVQEHSARKLLFNMIRITGVSGFRVDGDVIAVSLVRGAEEVAQLKRMKHEYMLKKSGKWENMTDFIFHISGLSGRTLKQDIENTLSRLDVKFTDIQYEVRDKEAWVQLKHQQTAQATIENLKSVAPRLKINNSQVTLSPLPPQKEKRYVKAAIKSSVRSSVTLRRLHN